VPFLSSYLIVRATYRILVVTTVLTGLQVISFIALFVLLKVIRGAEWFLVDLSNAEKAADRIRMLHDIRLGAS
jgi:type IV secretory pathway component VirB8